MGAKGSTARSYQEKKDINNLRNWHYMWSSFYFYKKNYSYLYALKKMFGKFIRSLMKVIFFSLTFQNQKKTKYLYRFLGIMSAMIGLKANYRAKEFY